MYKSRSSLGGNTGAVLAGAATFLAFALGAYLAFGRAGEEADVQTAWVGQDAQTVQNAPVVAEVQPPPDVQTAAPSFDTLRREPDGTTIIAGRAAPLSNVKIFVDGRRIGTATADSSGGFAAIATLPAKDTAQIVSLSAQSGEDVTVSVDEVILAPSVAPNKAVVQPDAEGPDQAVAEAPAPELSESADKGSQALAVAPPPVPEQSEVSVPNVAVLKSDRTGVQLMSPQVTSEVALDTIGYSDIGEVQLSGRAQPNTSKVRVYLNNRSVISLPVDIDGRWRGDLPDVDEGVYTLRVDEVDADGSVSSRVETPFKRESAAVLEQASAQSEGPLKSVTVQAGATLWAIARDRYGDGTLYVRVFEANDDAIRDPDLIYPGQVFDLPN